MASEYRGRQRYLYEVCAQCYRRRPNDQELTLNVCYSPAEHGMAGKICVTHVNDRLQIVRPRPVLVSKDKRFVHCGHKYCSKKLMFFVVIRNVQHAEPFYDYHSLSLPRNVPKDSAHIAQPGSLVPPPVHGSRSPYGGTSQLKSGSKVRH